MLIVTPQSNSVTVVAEHRRRRPRRGGRSARACHAWLVARGANDETGVAGTILAPRVIIMWVFVLTVSVMVMVMVRERRHDLY